jgi:hypothetical protein
MAIKTSLHCPLCGNLIEGYVNDVTKTDLLMGHIATEHVSKIRPASPKEGPPLPRGLNIRWPWSKV